MVQVIQIPIPFTNLVYGTGVISVAGISFTFLQTATGSVTIMMVSTEDQCLQHALKHQSIRNAGRIRVGKTACYQSAWTHATLQNVAMLDAAACLSNGKLLNVLAWLYLVEVHLAAVAWPSTAGVPLQANGATFDEAYGRFIGVLLPTSMLVVLISFMPEWMVKRIFPPVVPGVTIFLIGAVTSFES